MSNIIKFITTQGCISDSIEINQNGEDLAIKNTDENWVTLYKHSQKPNCEVIWEHHDYDGNITTAPFNESPAYTYRKGLFAKHS